MKTHHFVFSKMMCWLALNLGIQLGQELNYSAPYDDWQKIKDEIYQAILTYGYDHERGTFIQAFDSKAMDASLLLLPIFSFIDPLDERMIRTTNVIIEELEENGLIRRYPPGVDGLKGNEGVFIICTFWLANILARQNRPEEALKYFNNAISTGNSLGLFSEQFDTHQKIMLGNFPQALSHLSMIRAAMILKNPDHGFIV